MGRHVTRVFCAVAAGSALVASGLTAGWAAGAAGAVRPSLSGRTAQSAITCCVSAVAATSVRNAWAVGGGPRTVILHWTGTAWKRVPSPSLAGSLSSVTAISAGDAWAVGDTSTQPGKGAPLILHWNGKAWKQVPSPNPGAGSVLGGVAATSARSAQERVGGRLRRWRRAGPDRALERRLLDDLTGHVYLADSFLTSTSPSAEPR